MPTEQERRLRRRSLQAKQRKALITREMRRTRVAELALQELNFREIGERLGISKPQAKRDLDYVRSEWQTARLDAFEELRGRERGRLELVIKEAWAAWYRSLKPHNRRRIESEPDAAGEPKPTKIIVDSIIEEPDGDPRYLEVIRKASESLRKLDGLDIPVPQEITGKGGGPIEVVGLIQLVKQMEDLPPPPTDLELITKAIGFDPGTVQLEDEGNGEDTEEMREP